MFVSLKIFARTLVLPPASLLIAASWGMVLIWRGRQRAGWALLIAGVASLWLLATPVISRQLVRVTEGYPALNPAELPRAQAIVILGGGAERIDAPEYGGASLAGEELERVTYGAFLAHRTSLPVLVSGTFAEATAMAASLQRDFGVPTRWQESQSRDTYENAHFSVQLLRTDRIRRILLVTSSLHIRRATREFQGVGLEVVPAPTGSWVPRQLDATDFVPQASALMQSAAAVYELIGEPVRRVFAWLHVRRYLDPRVP
ncbi:MAG TPA: YdcF family protein [Steroidobacteraceae bacterium]|nr:YdcF family protein [Steroidobacteraceae bacterium]